MKKYAILKVFAAMAIAIAVISCDDDDDNSINGCDREECEILQNIGVGLGITFEGDPLKWEGVSWTAPVPGSGLRHIRGLRFENNEIGNVSYSLSEEIGKLYYLRSLYLKGHGIRGEFPKSLADNGTLDTLEIHGTLMTSLPDNIFNSHMKRAWILDNLEITSEIPSSVSLLRGKEYPAQFQIRSTRIYGTVPALSDVNIWLERNLLSGSDPSNAFISSQYLKSESDSQELFGVHLTGNFLHGELSEKLLADTLALIHFDIMAGSQFGKGFSNMPPYEEMMKRSREYYANHPEYVDLTSRIPF